MLYEVITEERRRRVETYAVWHAVVARGRVEEDLAIEDLGGDLDPRLLREASGRLRERQALHLHQEGKDVPPLAAAKTMIRLTRLADAELV